MRKIIYILLVVFAVGTGGVVYILFFTKAERKATIVRKNTKLIHSGMLIKEVKNILPEPDTVYYYSGLEYGSGVKVFEYYQGFAAPDVLRVMVRMDTVVDAVSEKGSVLK